MKKRISRLFRRNAEGIDFSMSRKTPLLVVWFCASTMFDVACLRMPFSLARNGSPLVVSPRMMTSSMSREIASALRRLLI